MRLLAVLAGIAFGTVSPAANAAEDLGLPPEPPALTRLEGAQPLLIAAQPQQLVVFTGLDAQRRFRFDTETGPMSVAADEMVRWGNPVPASGSGMRVTLTDGSVLIAAPAWKVDEPYQLDEHSLRMTTLRFGTVSIRRSQLEAIDLVTPPRGQTSRDDHRRPDAGRSGRDLLYLVHGDRMRGHVRAIGEDGVRIDTASGPLVVQLDDIETVRFRTLSIDRPPPKRLLRIGLSDGSRLVVRETLLDAGDTPQRTMELISGAKLPWPEDRHVAYIQPTGGRVQYLSDRTPARYQHVPYLDLTWPHATDRNVLGGELLAGNRIYAKGIGMHSAARLVFQLDGQSKRFAADIAIDNAAGKRGSVIFRVFLAREGAWHESFKSPIVRGGDPPRPVAVDLENARGLALVVDFADYGDERDLANWLDARLE